MVDCRSIAWVAWVGLVAAACGREPESAGSRSGTCVAPPRPQLDEAIAFERVFPQIDVEEGVALTHLPGDDSRWYVVTKPGLVYTFAASGGEPEVFVDLRDRVAVDGEAGLLGIAFHPDFATNGEVFLSYTAPDAIPFRSVVARFVSLDGGRTLDPGSVSELLSIDQPYSNHNGGDIHFGRDGFLYAGFGDGGSAGDPQDNGQDPDTLLGKLLRIDVDGGEPYGIPADNPFAAGGGAPEIFAWGLRNPWRFAVDRETGDIWVGDVGQNLWEEVDHVTRGGNNGWSVREGDECFELATCTDTIAPIATYRNTGGASVVGGAVYRGRDLPELTGAFLYSDFYRGTVYAVRAGEPAAVLHRSGARRFADWAEDDDGEIYGLDLDGGIYRVVAAEPHDDDAFPRTLLASGCVRSDDPTLPIDELVPYEVNVPFWSDGADKHRYLAVPRGRIGVGEDGDFDLPVGSVLLKSFVRDDVPIETRLLVRHDDGEWAGYSYAWLADGSDAELVVDARTVDIGGGPWVFPAIEDCTYCHTAAAGGSLGLETAQLARTVDGMDGMDQLDQLDHFVELGLLRERPAGAALPAADASIGERARAWLHVNCSQCHRPEGPAGRARLDLRMQTSLAESGLCDSPKAGTIDLADPRIVSPGAPEMSVLLARVRSTGGIRMPPVASLVVDDDGAALLDAWITGLASCP
ncbi:MAG TPA: PQQ-dependent sugar dehydrogenase [Nannocystaceae bacterium]|nr:PQQ-dependent sugar dehydrogenase [Nannocystaceae bacterium]